MSKLSYEDNVIIITGAGAGLGKAYALFFASRGAKVVVNDFGNIKLPSGESAKSADVVVQEIRKNGGIAVANYDSVEFGEKIVKTAVDSFGKVDVLINNAGIIRDKVFKNLTKDDWDIIMKIHLGGMFACTSACWPIFMKQKYGRIINVSSPSGLFGSFGQANYSSAKAGIYGFTKTLALEGAKYNIFTNCISPVAFTDMSAHLMPKDFAKMFKVDYITPVIAYLSHKECEDNGGIYEVAGSHVNKLRFERSNGVFFGSDMTLESFKERVKEVGDFTNRKEFDEDETLISIVVNSYEKLKENKTSNRAKF